jgi:hypothetical protein
MLYHLTIADTLKFQGAASILNARSRRELVAQNAAPPRAGVRAHRHNAFTDNRYLIYR